MNIQGGKNQWHVQGNFMLKIANFTWETFFILLNVNNLQIYLKGVPDLGIELTKMKQETLTTLLY